MRRIGDKNYVPFDLKDPVHRYCLRQRGWIRNYKGEEHLITMMTDTTIYAQGSISPEILLRDWTFLDGKPCGVEKVDLEGESSNS